jgi:transposase
MRKNHIPSFKVASKKSPKITSTIVKSFDDIVVIKAMLNRFCLASIIDKYIVTERDRGGPSHGEIVEVLVLNRLSSPTPLYNIETWAHDHGVADLYGYAADKFNDDRIRRTLDDLWQYEDVILDECALKIGLEFEVPFDELLYDLTSIYFEGNYENEEDVKLGYSRDQKPDKKQVNLGLTVTRLGNVPLLSKVFPGNTSDPSTVKANIEALKKLLKKKSYLRITDGIMINPESIHVMEQEGLDFLGPYQADTHLLESLDLPNLQWEKASYSGAKDNEIYKTYDTQTTIVYKEETDQQPSETPKKRGRKPRHAITEHSYSERIVVVYSSSKASRDQKTREKAIIKIAEKLDKIKTGINRYRLKTRCAVVNKVNEILNGPQAKYKKCVNIDIRDLDNDTMEFSWNWKQDMLDKLATKDGVYTLITNKRDVSAEEILELYKSRNGVESRFRDLKSTIKIRPLFVHTEERIRSLVLITILALQIYSLIEWEAKKAGLDYTSKVILKAFEGVSVLQTEVKENHYEIEWINLTYDHFRILERLKLALFELPDFVTFY